MLDSITARSGRHWLAALAVSAMGWSCGGSDEGGGSAGAAGGDGGYGGGQGGHVAFGDFSRLEDLAWIDTHVHLKSHLRIDDYVAYQDAFGMESMALQCVFGGGVFVDGTRPNQNAEALLAKLEHPDRFYVFGGIDLSPLATEGEQGLADDLEAQINELAAAGVDGVKLWFRTDLVEALEQEFNFEFVPDSPTLAKAFAAIEAHDLPVLIHLDLGFAANGMNALDLYPDVTWLVTHMGFAGTNFDRLEAMLAKSSSIFIDAGHYVHLGESLQDTVAARAFFTTHAARIFQSTDLGAGCGEAGYGDDDCPPDDWAVDTAWKLRALLETAQPVSFASVYQVGSPNITVTGLNLPSDVLAKVYHDNAANLLAAPKPVQCTAALAHVDRLIGRTTAVSDLSRLEAVRAQMVGVCP